MFQPTINMATVWVFMRPMDNAALLAPFVFAVKRDGVAFFQAANFRRKVYIVRKQQRLPAGKFYDKALMARALRVIGQGFNHAPAALNLQIALAVLVSLLQSLFKMGSGWRGFFRLPLRIPTWLRLALRCAYLRRVWLLALPVRQPLLAHRQQHNQHQNNPLVFGFVFIFKHTLSYKYFSGCLSTKAA